MLVPGLDLIQPGLAECSVGDLQRNWWQMLIFHFGHFSVCSVAFSKPVGCN